LGAAFTAVGLCLSNYTNNPVVAFLLGAAVCFALYSGFNAVAGLPVFKAGADYYLEQMGMHFHYRGLSKGVIDSRDLIYFGSLIFFFLYLTAKRTRQPA
jgi:ABC-2 type transport system permease protein